MGVIVRGRVDNPGTGTAARREVVTRSRGGWQHLLDDTHASMSGPEDAGTGTQDWSAPQADDREAWPCHEAARLMLQQP